MTLWSVKEWTQLRCERCGRMRVNRSMNDLHLCEKCDWCPELQRHITDEELDAPLDGETK